MRGSQQEALEQGFVLLGIRQQGIPVILKELMFPDGFDHVSPSFTTGNRFAVRNHLVIHLNNFVLKS
ncbi:unnamed protein product [Schistosoma curassoni]|uniref:Formyl_trans_C domain-containing protein n=1 Tax=Schistosoma curassoni TaxID=6186 RepID=A0A183JWT9_9TREM|nr:unnamed protein product [Schistosoma curassoni]